MPILSRWVSRVWPIALVVGLAAPGRAETLYVSEQDGGAGGLLVVDSSAPPTLQFGNPISGLQPGEGLAGIAVRPSTGTLYGVGSTSRLYTVQPGTGAATPIGSAPFAPALQGTQFGMHFDPVSDRLRVVSDTGQNLLIDPIGGGVASVGASLAYAVGDPHFGATPRITALAYSPNDPFATSATAYGIDLNTGALVRLGSPDPADGTLHTVGIPNPDGGQAAGPADGFDVSRVSGIAYALHPGFTPALVTIDLTTGLPSFLGSIGGQFTFFNGLAVAPECQPDDSAMCLGNDRFRVTATFDSGTSGSGNAHTSPITRDTGYLWFFSAANVEAVVKVLNGCSVNGRYWVFAGGLTNVKVDLTITDMANGTSKVYHNPQGTAFQPIQDTSAFATCP
ncbi:MAG TPA: DUF4394 domain-containing protein [Thermoanaerobaculia bacterium]|nr:DUF4394 domain-containing protein [Thermoanaerobaculia bacterium]